MALKIDVLHEVNARDDTLRVLARDPELSAALQSDADEERLVALLSQLLYSNIASDFNAASELDAHPAEYLDLAAENVLLEPEFRQTVHHHAARSLLLLEYCNRISVLSEIICG